MVPSHLAAATRAEEPPRALARAGRAGMGPSRVESSRAQRDGVARSRLVADRPRAQCGARRSHRTPVLARTTASSPAAPSSSSPHSSRAWPSRGPTRTRQTPGPLQAAVPMAGAIQVVTKLRNRHSQGESAACINVHQGRITNIMEENLIVPLLVHASTITLATPPSQSSRRLAPVSQSSLFAAFAQSRLPHPPSTGATTTRSAACAATQPALGAEQVVGTVALQPRIRTGAPRPRTPAASSLVRTRCCT